MFLGVDGGGTKTEFVLLAADGSLRARHQQPGSYYIQVGMEEVRRILLEGTRALLGQAGVAPAAVRFAFFGLPAHGEDQRHTRLLDGLPLELLPAERYRCGNDMVCGWAGSLACEDGINVVAGTGSICYGEHRGRGARCGGWGELFSDEGSAYWIAREGLNAFSKMSDGRAPRGPLHALLVRRLDLPMDLQVTDVVYNDWKQERSRIAALSQWVKEAADAGDALARDIFRRAGEELAAMIALGIALGAWLGRLLAGGMLAPVLRLSHEVERADPGVELHGIADDHRHDEVGALANAFLRYQSRVNAAIEREVLFSVDAGHELRTPLTTLQGALDLLDAQIVQAPARRKIQRIRRSAAEIGLLIDALLLVTVSDEAVDHPASVVEWRGAIASALTEYQPELDHAQVRVGVRCAPDATIHAHPRLLATMLRLLLRAMANGSFGQDLHIDVDGAGLRLAAADTMPEAALAGNEDVPTAIDVQRSDEIAGLGMLRRLCERHRWRLVLEGAGSGSGLLPLRLLAPA